MRRRGRVWRVVKWTGLTVCAGFLAFEYLAGWAKDQCSSSPSSWYWRLSLAMPACYWPTFVLIVLATVYAWLADHRDVPPGRCRQCGYDLTGNVSGRCPECGSETKRPAD